jgi:hypothetical protein
VPESDFAQNIPYEQEKDGQDKCNR